MVLTRKTHIPFGSGGVSTDFEQFGSKVAGNPVNTLDPAVIEALAAWTEGWAAAVVNSNQAPYLEDENAVDLAHSYHLAYLLQEGIAEYDSGTTYNLNSVVKKSGTTEIYISLVSGQSGNALPSRTSNSKWQYCGSLATGISPSGIITEWSGTLSTIPVGYQLCDGTNGTPNLLGQFIMCVPNGSTNPGAGGGALSHFHAVNNHTHTVPSLSIPAMSASIPAMTTSVPGSTPVAQTVQAGSGDTVANFQHYHTLPVSYASIPASTYSTGVVPTSGTDFHLMNGTDTQSNLPPYYMLAKIMKMY